MKKKILPYILYFCTILAASAAFTAVYFSTGKQFSCGQMPPSGEIFAADGGWVMTQSFDAEDGVCGAALSLTAPDGDGILSVTVLSPEGDVLATRMFSGSGDYSEPEYTAFSDIFGRSGGRYSVRIESEGYGAPGVRFSVGGGDAAYLDGTLTDYTLSVLPIYPNRVASGMFFTLLFGIMALLALIYFLISRPGLGSDSTFLVCISAFLLVGMLIIPLGAGASEKNDLPALYAMCGGRVSSDGSRVSMPSGVAHLIFGDVDYKSTIEAMSDDGTREFVPFEEVSGLAAPPVTAAVGMLTAKLFTDNPGILFYSARMSSVLFAMVMLYLAIRLLPFGKRIFFAICLNPALLTVFSTVSSVSLPILCSFLLFAAVLRMRESGKNIGVGETLVIGCLSVLCCFSGAFCLPLCLLPIFAISGERKKHISFSRRFAFTLSAVILPAALGIAYAVITVLSDRKLSGNLRVALISPVASAENFAAFIKDGITPIFLFLFGDRICADGSVFCGGIVSIFVSFLIFFCAVFEEDLKGRFSDGAKILLLAVGGSVALVAAVQASALSSISVFGAVTLAAGVLPMVFAFGGVGILSGGDRNGAHLRSVLSFAGLFPFAFAMLSAVVTFL